MHIYLDESGDLGFEKDGSSEHFVITLLMVEDPTGINRCVKRLRGRKLKKKLKELPEIKANNSSEAVRKRLLRDLAGEDIEIHCIVLKKERVYDYLRKKTEKLYNYISGIIIAQGTRGQKEVNMVVDKRVHKRIIREDFDQYIERKIKESAVFHKRVKVSHLASQNSPGLQAVDFVSWSIFRKYEWRDDSYYNLIKDKIKTEERLFE